MSFRTKLFLVFGLAVAGTVSLVTWAVSESTRRAFEQIDEHRTQAFLAQFRREFALREEQVAATVQRIAESEALLRVAIDLSRSESDRSSHVYEAERLAPLHSLDLLEFTMEDGTILSSAQWPARFGYRSEKAALRAGPPSRRAFLDLQELPDREVLGLVAVQEVKAGDHTLMVTGGLRLDQAFLSTLALPAGMRALLYSNLQPDFNSAALIGVNGPVERGDRLAPLIGEVQEEGSEVTRTLVWTEDPASAEVLHAIPLAGSEGRLLAILLVGSSQESLVRLRAFIRRVGIGTAAAGVLLGLLLAWWFTARVTRPVRQLVTGAREVSGGNWNARVDIYSRDEVGTLASAFNQMTSQLSEQRERLVQAERVAAWRELARRLAHELKNPLFPLQITVENLQRARERHPDQFDEVFREGTATLLAELSNLRSIVARFGDFAKMPQPRFEKTDVNAIVRRVVRLFEAQLAEPNRSKIAVQVTLDEAVRSIQADSEQLQQALQNLVLNGLDAMPQGGVLHLLTQQQEHGIRIEVSDSGTGLTDEEKKRLFTPYYTTKRHGTGLGLAIVQSVVSDHRGRISVVSKVGQGSRIVIDLPQHQSESAIADALGGDDGR
ncbi:MAG: ATP-binding protein [Acidobacteriota bacterium]